MWTLIWIQKFLICAYAAVKLKCMHLNVHNPKCMRSVITTTVHNLHHGQLHFSCSARDVQHQGQWHGVSLDIKGEVPIQMFYNIVPHGIVDIRGSGSLITHPEALMTSLCRSQISRLWWIQLVAAETRYAEMVGCSGGVSECWSEEWAKRWELCVGSVCNTSLRALFILSHAS